MTSSTPPEKENWQQNPRSREKCMYREAQTMLVTDVILACSLKHFSCHVKKNLNCHARLSLNTPLTD